MHEELIPTVLETLFSIIKVIYVMVGKVKDNKERCQELTKRVELIEKMILKLHQKGQIPPSLEDTLWNLCDNLQSTKKWMEKYTQNKRITLFFWGGKHEEKFRKLNQKLSENCQALSLALLVEHGEKIDVIHDTLVQRGAIRQRNPIPSFCPAEPTPSPRALMPSMPPPGPSNFALDINYAPFNPVIPQPVPLSNIGFSNAIYNTSPWVSPFSNFPNVAGINNIPQYSSVAVSNNGTVAFVSKTTYYMY